MNTLVTGGNGLVGCNISGKFKPTKDELNILNYDDTLSYIEDNNIDSIVHCAAKVGGIKANSENLGQFYYENITMNTNILHASMVAGVNKVVSFMSTCIFPAEAEYPLTIKQMHNGHPHLSNYGYAYAKRMLEVQSRAYREQYGCNFVTVIPCNIYGPNDNFNLDSGHVIPSLIHKCWNAKENKTDFEIWGTGQPYREFIYSEDVGKIIEWVLDNYNDKEPLIISSDTEISIATVAQEIAWRMGYKGNIVFNQENDGQFRKPSDNSKLKSLLPDFKFTPIEEGIETTINWFIDNYERARK